MKNTTRSKASRLAPVLAAAALGIGQVGCNTAAVPVAEALKRVIYWLGQKAAESAVFIGVEMLFDNIFGSSSTEPEMEVVLDPSNPFQGRCKGPLTLQNGDDKNKTLILVDYPVYRDSVGGKWKVAPDHVRRIELALKGY